MNVSLARAAEECRQILTQQEISTSGPGTILTDIQTMIDFIGVGGLPTQSEQGNLPFAVLPELNARVSQPVELFLKRPFLRDYPNLAGPYILLRVMDLVHVNEKRVWINEEKLKLWSELNSTEKYFALLEAWLILADEGVLGASNRPGMSSQLAENVNFLANTLSSKWKNFDEWTHLYRFLGGVSSWNAQLQARFGLIEMEPRPLEGRRSVGRGWVMEKAMRTPWGKAVAWAILAWLHSLPQEQELPEPPTDLFGLPLNQEPSRDDEPEEEDIPAWLLFGLPEDAGFGFLQTAFQPFFPQWQKTFAAPQAAIRPGVYTFKVSLDPRYFRTGGAWRRLAVPDRTSLDELAWAVLAAFDFEDTEHLYDFQFRDHLGKSRIYYHPYDEEEPHADDITVGELDLPEKGMIKFLFDYGDSWRFILRLEHIDPPDRKLKKPKVIASKGKALAQYPNTDDW